MEIDLGHWTLSDGLVFDPDALGFVYLITLPNGKKYIGCKLMVMPTKIVKTFKNGNKTKVKKYKESKWKCYTSSSAIINEFIKNNGKDGVIFMILHFHHSKSSLKYHEAKEQFDRGVLLSGDYLNSIINLRISKIKDK